MTTISSKTTNASTSLDSMMGMFLPRIHESSSQHSPSTSFRTTTTNPYANDPELYMGDDSDCDYAQALMQSGLFSTHLHSSFDQDSDFSDTDDHSLQVSIQRLRLLLAHLKPHTTTSTKGKSKAFY